MIPPALIDKLEDLKRLLERAKTIAVVGLSDDPQRESNEVAAYLRERGYRIIGVNPNVREVFGEPVYPSLSAIPEELKAQIDLVAVFRRPEGVPALIDEAARLGLQPVWLQLGVSSPAAMEAAAQRGIPLIAEKCLRVVHALARVEAPGSKESEEWGKKKARETRP